MDIDNSIGKKWLAHSKGYKGQVQTQFEHISEVRRLAIKRCPSFLSDDVNLAAIFHDFGKYSIRFQRRLEGMESGLDHWSPGAHLLLKYRLSDLAAIAVQAHHVGLESWGQVSTLKNELVSPEGRRLTLSTPQELNNAFQAMLEEGFKPLDYKNGHRFERTVGSMLDARMVLSALVHADYTDTAKHMRGENRPEVSNLDARAAFEILEKYVTSLRKDASSIVKEVRRDLWDAALNAADKPPGLYELEAPTGSGKTLAMLGFALRHIAKHIELGLRRIVVVLPFLSILDQTVKEYRSALGVYANGILEHHSLADWRNSNEEDGESEERKRAEVLSEDWEAPIIVTTSVQFFESLFTAHPGTSRKLCALSRAVILLDEVQSLPQKLISPTLRAISRLCHPDYGSTVVVATATQPLFSRFAKEVEHDGGNVGWHPISIAQRTIDLYKRTRRYQINWSRCLAPVSWGSIADELIASERVLCIVNTRKDARLLTELVMKRKPQAPLFHLSTNMCSAHRRVILDYEAIKNRNSRCILISTQCVEAGVDIDFPVIYRALAPFDSIGQAAGRCNRGGIGNGYVIVFIPEEAVYPGKQYEQGALLTLSLLKEFGELDPQDPKFFDLYFKRLYDLTADVGTSRKMEQAISEADFPEVDRLYQLIEHRKLLHIIVPYNGVPEIPYKLTGSFFRNVQPYVVDANIKDAQNSAWIGSPLKGTDDWFVLSDKHAYDRVVGLRLEEEIPVL
ncbi:MAG TPA: CRISPR-associated helicase Cas3' [Rectinema sp.]|nr:CRISPR-associated helicase Cas3' [Rectinema sp.]